MKQFPLSTELDRFWQRARTELAIAETNFHATTLSDPAISTAVDRLASLAAQGKKTATSHLLIDFERNSIPSRKAGDFWIILGASGQPACLVEITQTVVRPFRAVDVETAVAEGGGDLSLEYWREVHLAYFRKQCAAWNLDWSDDMPVRTEFFKLKWLSSERSYY